MHIEEIMDLWEADAKIDKTELGDETLKIPLLHSKYYNILIREKLLYRKYEAELKQLKVDKFEFFTQGHNEFTKDKNWKLPAKGLVLKQDIPVYMDADKEIVELNLKIGLQLEKISLLESIIKVIMNRTFIIRDAIAWQKFTMGA